MNSLTSFYRAMSAISRDAANVARSPTSVTTEKMRDSLERCLQTVDELNKAAAHSDQQGLAS